IRTQIIEPIVRGMARAGTPFRGTLFANLMLVPGGVPTLFEVNVRFGDPETQVLANVLEGDLAELLHAAARGDLGGSGYAKASAERHALCVILAAAGYPGEPRAGDAIAGLDRAANEPGVRVYHAGTRRDGDRIVTAGGRVLAVTGVGENLQAAHERAY